MSSSETTTTNEPSPPQPPPPQQPPPSSAFSEAFQYFEPIIHRRTPTSQSFIESLPTITLTSIINPTESCPVCKDHFAINDLLKTLPCEHRYHVDCIVPWLERSSSCPVCRFEMPKQPKRRVSSFAAAFRAAETVEDRRLLRVGFLRGLGESGASWSTLVGEGLNWSLNRVGDRVGDRHGADGSV